MILLFDSGMPRPRPSYVHREKSRHGTVRWVFRKGHGPRIVLPGPPGSPGFDKAYHEALAGLSDAPAKQMAGSLEWMIDEYRRLAEWQALAPSTRKVRENLFHRLMEAVGKDADPNSITQRVMQRAVDSRSANAGRNMLKAYRPLFRWAERNGHIAADPTSGLHLAKVKSQGFHTWSVEEVDAFQAHWKAGTRERLAMDLLLFTGLRRSDVVRLGRQHVRGDMIELAPRKTEKDGVTVYIPMTAPLQEALKHAPQDNLTFLLTAHGKPFEAASFGNWFRKACEAAGVPGRAHGLRKAGATMLAERGASPHALMAIFGWRTLAQAEHYTREANRRKLAKEAGRAFGS